MQVLETNLVQTGKSFLDFKRESDSKTFPQDFTNYIKSKGDIYFWPQGGFHVVTQAELAKEVLDSKTFSADRSSFFISRMPNIDLRLLQDFFGVVSKMMVMSDDKAHLQRKRMAAVGFEDHIIERFKFKLEETIEKLVSQIEPGQEFDFTLLAKALPSTVLADMFNINSEHREDFFHWSNTMTEFFGGAVDYTNDVAEYTNQCAAKLRTFFQDLINERRQMPGMDYISLLIKAQARFKLSDDELISQAIMMLVAGQVTTTDQINNCMYQLLLNSDVQLALHKDRSSLMNIIEHYKKVDPAVTFLFRVAREDTVIGRQVINKGETVFISNHAVNADLPEGQHFAYGYGSHFCLGAKLGRLQMEMFFSSIVKKFSKLELVNDHRDHYSLAFSGFKKMTVKFHE